MLTPGVVLCELSLQLVEESEEADALPRAPTSAFRDLLQNSSALESFDTKPRGLIARVENVLHASQIYDWVNRQCVN